MTYRGTVYGLPLNYKVITMIYNKKLVADAAEDLGRAGGQLAKKLTDAATGRFGLAYWYSNFYYHAPLMNAFGGRRLRRRAASRSSTRRRTSQSLELLMKWVEQDKILPAEPSTALVTSLFNEGKAAIVFSGPWFLGEIAKGDRLRPGAAAHDRRGGRQADAAVDDRRGRLHRRAVEEQGRRLRLRRSTSPTCRRRRSSRSKGARRRPTRRSTTTRRSRPTP